jgi:ethanolamine permease
MSSNQNLKKTLSPIHLWGLGVGYVISGMYFGWNLGLEQGGTLSMAIATGVIIVMYVMFSLSYSELACAIPKAGGAFDYTNRAMGKNWGFVVGMAQNIEFIFAPPAIAVGIGSYINGLLPVFSINQIFTILNILGAKLAATFELIITVLAVIGLILFAGITLPHFEYKNLIINALPHGHAGTFAAIPFAIWFFLGIEGLANVAEESLYPQRDITRGFGSAMLTLVLLCLLTFVASIGIDGWQGIVYKSDGSTSDSPLPLALSKIMSDKSLIYQLLVGIGTCGLIASFHGLVLASGRSVYEFGKMGNAPRIVGKIHPKFKTPANALILNMIIGIALLLTNSTAQIITLAVFGALIVYIFSMIALLILRKSEPSLHRPFRTPFYPYSTIIALIIALISLIAMVYYNSFLAMIFFGILVGSFLIYLIISRIVTQ